MGERSVARPFPDLGGICSLLHPLKNRRSEFGDKTDDICGVHLPLDIRCSYGYDLGWHSNSLVFIRQTKQEVNYDDT